ncbi:ATP-dependent helicase [Ruminococcaceae bacterium OttesenSCG-928-A11]|nr:ATP-dependent helicase [Ruminococcaceae bacterium OttesenSCG-928-A11]
MTQEEFAKQYLSKLDKQQQEAVQTVEGATLLLAVPGSGKTTVLVTRLGYMVYCDNIPAGSILTMTYTVAATKEMQQRFTSMFGTEYADALGFRTINGLSAKIIDYYVRNHSKRQPFTLLENEGELSRLIGQIHQKVNDEYATESAIKDIRTGITYIKNMILGKEEIEHLDVGVPNMPEIYQQYCAELKRRGQMDYDDQMSYALTILNSQPPVLEYFQEKYRYICVDETQDTSKIQHAIIHLLAKKYGNIFMVGDEDQSIYGFRAAYPDALLNFKGDYQGAKVLLVEQNYRSTNEIVEVANRFVSKNRFRYQKSIHPTRGEGLPVQIIDAIGRSAQYKYLFAEAQNCQTETAVLFRNNDSALPLIDMLERSGIPYNCRQFDGVFFSHRIIGDITDIINFAYDQNDADSFMRIYYKFGNALTKKAAVYACEQSNRSGKPILEELVHYPELSRYAKEGVINLLTLLPMVAKNDAVKAIQLIWNTAGYGQYVTANKLDAGKYTTLCLLGEHEASPKDLLRRLAELRDIIRNHTNSSSNKILLSTIHSSKGLEYERVYLLDIFNGILPAKAIPDAGSQDEIKHYEEDRRLYYVGMTRAKNELYLFSCHDTESAFTSEVKGSLPQEIVDADSVMALFRQNLCSKKYTHQNNGTGTVIAQCGYSVLVEYESGKLQLLTLSQLFEQRDLKVKYAQVDTAAKGLQSERKNQQGVSISKDTEKQLLSKAVVGCDVTHNKFGHGTISKTDGQYVSIRFDGISGEKKFDLLMVVKNGLIEI